MNLKWTSKRWHKGRCRRASESTRPPALALELLESRHLLATFLPAVSYAPGDNPRAVTVADINADKLLDLLVAGAERGGHVSVLLGNGDGTFQTRQYYVVGDFEPVALAVGDFDGDGFLDVATGNSHDRIGVSLLLNNGDGSFRFAGHYGGVFPTAVAVGDFNQDSFLDVVTTNDIGNSLSVLLGNGDGTFQDPRVYRAGRDAADVAVTDFNGDGLADLVLANLLGQNVSVLLGNGDGTFAPAVNTPTGRNPWSVAVGDFNGDGPIDLAVAIGAERSVRVLLGSGDGSFVPVKDCCGAGDQPRAITAGDWDGDAILDLAVANFGDNTVSVLFGNSDGTFRPDDPRDYAVGSNPTSQASGDFNGDGYPDLVVLNRGTQRLSVLLNAGPGSSPSPPGGGGSPANADGAAAAALAGGLPPPSVLAAVTPVRGVTDPSPLHQSLPDLPSSEQVIRQEVTPVLASLKRLIGAQKPAAPDDALVLADLARVWSGGAHPVRDAASGAGIDPH